MSEEPKKRVGIGDPSSPREGNLKPGKDDKQGLKNSKKKLAKSENETVGNDDPWEKASEKNAHERKEAYLDFLSLFLKMVICVVFLIIVGVVLAYCFMPENCVAQRKAIEKFGSNVGKVLFGVLFGVPLGALFGKWLQRRN